MYGEWRKSRTECKLLARQKKRQSYSKVIQWLPNNSNTIRKNSNVLAKMFVRVCLFLLSIPFLSEHNCCARQECILNGNGGWKWFLWYQIENRLHRIIFLPRKERERQTDRKKNNKKIPKVLRNLNAFTHIFEVRFVAVHNATSFSLVSPVFSNAYELFFFSISFTI